MSHVVDVRGRTAVRIGAPNWAAMWPVIAATLFNAVLCIVATRGFSVDARVVAFCEIVITGCALFLGRSAIDEMFVITLGALIGFCTSLWLIARGDLTVLRDLGIPFAFFALGAARGKVEGADVLIYVLLSITTVFALFEWFDLAAFTRVFDILSYYFNKGAVGTNQLTVTGTRLFISGIRTQRMLLPFLGEQRISSIFLEPISIANFAVISFGWLMCRLPKRPLINGIFVAVCLGLIVLADSRFALVLACVIAVLCIAARRIQLPVGMFLPGAVLLLLAFVAIVPVPPVYSNTFTGRLYGSGEVLASFDLSAWFGLSPPATTPWDSGYAYIFGNVGIIGVAIAWLAFLGVPAASAFGQRFRTVVAVYIAALLCISGVSVFSIKTAALLWFLYGCAVREPREVSGSSTSSVASRLSAGAPAL
jgi:putative polymerase